jgi:hypothetical protein
LNSVLTVKEYFNTTVHLENIMQFLCLAYGAEKDWLVLTKQQQEEYLANDKVLRDRGATMATVQTSVTTVTAWDGTPQTTHTSFAQSSVPLAGSSIIEAVI